jgi:hypothetical protein
MAFTKRIFTVAFAERIFTMAFVCRESLYHGLPKRFFTVAFTKRILTMAFVEKIFTAALPEKERESLPWPLIEKLYHGGAKRVHQAWGTKPGSMHAWKYHARMGPPRTGPNAPRFDMGPGGRGQLHSTEEISRNPCCSRCRGKASVGCWAISALSPPPKKNKDNYRRFRRPGGLLGLPCAAHGRSNAIRKVFKLIKSFGSLF